VGDIYNILITGIEGQGISLLGNILRIYGTKPPFIKNVVGTDIRENGSLVATIRYLMEVRNFTLEQGYNIDELISPRIPINDAHLVLGMEPLETLRNLKYISEKTVVILNTHKIIPENDYSNSEKKKNYPSVARIIDIIDQLARRVIFLDFNELSNIKFNSSNYASCILFGVGAKELMYFLDKNLIKSILLQVIDDSNLHIEAFEFGYNLVNEL